MKIKVYKCKDYNKYKRSKQKSKVIRIITLVILLQKSFSRNFNCVGHITAVLDGIIVVRGSHGTINCSLGKVGQKNLQLLHEYTIQFVLGLQQ